MSILPASGTPVVLLNRPTRWSWSADASRRRDVVRLVVIRDEDGDLWARVYADTGGGGATLAEHQAATAVTRNSVTVADGNVWRVGKLGCSCQVPRSLKNFRVTDV